MTLEFTGTQGVDLSENRSFDMSVFGITNPGVTERTGDIRIALWALEDPSDFEGFLIWYYELASFDLPGADTLAPGETLSFLTFSGTYREPVFDGLYSLAIVLLDDSGEGDPVILDTWIDDDTLLIGPPPPVSGFQEGTAGDDELSGLNTQDSIYGLGGNDRLSGAGNADLLYGGDGHDRLYGGNGMDSLWGGIGGDFLFGDVGRDMLRGEAGADRLYGGSQDDTAYGGHGDDWLTGGAGGDVLQGNAGADRMWGGGGADRLFGGNGADTLTGGAGGDLLHGGKGLDTASYSDDGRGVVVSLLDPSRNTNSADGDSHVSIEGLEGSRRADTLVGNHAANVLSGGAGSDHLRGERGADRLEGGEGRDTLWGGAGRDRLDGGFGADILRGGRGADTLSGNLGRDTFLFKRADLDRTTDHITDFEDGDRIDLTDLGLHWISGGFTGRAGELRFAADPMGYGNGRALADLDGDGRADLTIRIDGFFTAIDAVDFLL